MASSYDSRLILKADVMVQEVEGGAVLVNIGSGACFELNRIGLEIWRLLEQGTTSIGGIGRVLGARYAIDLEVLDADVRRLVDSLVDAGLVEVTEDIDRAR